MNIILPGPLPTTRGWALVDYRDVAGEAVAGEDGVALVEFGQLADDEMWLVDHAVVACSSASPTELRLYASVVTDRALLDGTSVGNFDVADWPAGLRIAPVTSLVARWTGAAPGAVATIALQVRVLRRT